MKDEDNFELLFEQKINDGLFSLKDTKLENEKLKAKESQKKLLNFVDAILSSEEKEKFETLLEERDDNYNSCFFLEQRLFYKYGINDGFSMVLATLKDKVEFTE